MKKIIMITAVGLLAIACANGQQSSDKAASTSEAESAEESTQVTTPPQPEQSDIPEGVKRLLKAYPDKIVGFEDNNLIFADGTKLIYDDGQKKDFETMLDNSDPEDMFFTAYDMQSTKPEYLNDSGRSRCEALFKKLYGSSAAEVEKQLVTVDWFGGKIKFSGSNAAAEQLKKVKAELEKHPELTPYLKSSGTFYWRNVRGANRLSAHSYGMAIDVAVDKSDYWLWKNPQAGELSKIEYANRIPMKIVEIFEKYGFVWGGRWYHYDTMHFEYRPELNPPK